MNIWQSQKAGPGPDFRLSEHSGSKDRQLRWRIIQQNRLVALLNDVIPVKFPAARRNLDEGAILKPT
jgi:hypothetical protein